jgi:Ca2+/H+ antiporter, TMEM165/GDT1 family
MFTGLLNLPTLLSSGLACFVEMVEALTIVLAVASVRGWRTAWAGAIPALIVLTLVVLLCGPLLRHLDLRPMQTVVGALLILFGMRWLRKAILRAAGRIALHDEELAFEHEVQVLERSEQRRRYGIDAGAMVTAFNGVLIEGIEVVFIVVAVGSTARRLDSAAVGALAALAAVVALGLLLRQPLSKIPENALKLIVGVMLMSLGTLWTGEGIGLSWPFGDWAVVAMSAMYFLVALVLAILFRKPHGRAAETS